MFNPFIWEQSWRDSIKPSLLFSNFGCYISKESFFTDYSALNPELGGVRNNLHLPLSLMKESIKPLFSLLSQFSKFGCCISKGSLFRFRDHNSCHCVVWRPEKVSQLYWYSDVSFTCSGPLGQYRVKHFYLGTELRSTRGLRWHEGCCICHYLSRTDSIKPNLLFSNFGCCLYVCIKYLSLVHVPP